MTEVWKPIEDFPGYEVSSYGYVRKTGYGQMSMSLTHDGTTKVNLSTNEGQFTRSVARLVATAFCVPHDSISDTPIHIDGDKYNNSWLNLAWRPRWFAWKYTNQFLEIPPQRYYVPVMDLRDRHVYPTVMAAGISDGVLWEDVYRSAVEGRFIYPTAAMYDFTG